MSRLDTFSVNVTYQVEALDPESAVHATRECLRRATAHLGASGAIVGYSIDPTPRYEGIAEVHDADDLDAVTADTRYYGEADAD